MPNINRYFTLLAVCLIVTACTDDSAVSTPTKPTTDSRTTAPVTTFSPTLTPWTGSFDGLAETQLCALDAVNGLPAADGTFSVQANQPIAFEGWVSTANLRNPRNLSIVLDGASGFQIVGATGIARADVAKAYSSSQLETAGFKIELATFPVPAGEYPVVFEHTTDGASVICRTNLRVIVS